MYRWRHPGLLVHILVLRTHQIREAAHRQPTGSCDKLQQPHPLLVVHLLDKLSGDHSVCVCVCETVADPVTRDDARGASGLLPARTRRSVCCCERNAGRWCFSASPPGRSPASRTASPAGSEDHENVAESFHLPAVGSVGTSNSLASKY